MNSTPNMYHDVVEFHQQILGVFPEGSPTLHSQEWITERMRFLTEEVNEYYEAGMTGDIVGTVHELLDVVYVALGTLYMLEVPVEACWALVQRANMAKVKGTTKRGNKIDATKPEGWVSARAGIAALILNKVNET